MQKISTVLVVSYPSPLPCSNVGNKIKNRAEFEFWDLPNDVRYVISQQLLKQLNLFFVTPDMFAVLTSLLVDFTKGMGEV
jgi:hypothetical protein